MNNTIDAITGVTIDALSNYAGLDMSRISFTENSIAINFQGLPTDHQPGLAKFNVSFGTPIPEPSTFLLVGAGLVGVGLLRKRFKI